jgi:hypothetical protein
MLIPKQFFKYGFFEIRNYRYTIFLIKRDSHIVHDAEPPKDISFAGVFCLHVLKMVAYFTSRLTDIIRLVYYFYMEEETTKNEILGAINEFATKTEERFQKIDNNLNVLKDDVRILKDDVHVLKDDVRVLKDDVIVLKDDVGTLNSQMVTKAYLDDKNANLRGDIITVVRKGDTKTVALMRILRKKNILTDDDMNDLLAMEPFPDLRASLVAS